MFAARPELLIELQSYRTRRRLFLASYRTLSPARICYFQILYLTLKTSLSLIIFYPKRVYPKNAKDNENVLKGNTRQNKLIISLSAKKEYFKIREIEFDRCVWESTNGSNFFYHILKNVSRGFEWNARKKKHRVLNYWSCRFSFMLFHGRLFGFRELF